MARRDPTQSMSVSPASSSLPTSESMALLVAVHARMRSPAGTRVMHAAVMNDDLPVPGGPCTTVTALSRPLSAARCPGLSRRISFFTAGSMLAWSGSGLDSELGLRVRVGVGVEVG